MITEQNRYRGALLGLACGEAIGAATSGKARGAFAELTEMADTESSGHATRMALCVADSLLEVKAFDAQDQLERYRSRHGGQAEYPTGGMAHLAPVAMYYALDAGSVLTHAAASSQAAQAAPQALECARLFALQLREAFLGHGKDAILAVAYPGALSPAVDSIARGAYTTKTVDHIHAGGDAVASLEAALWCFWHTSSFKQAVLQAANLGDAADVTTALCGQLAGAYYGVQDIPEPWLDQLAMQQEIILAADRLQADRAAGKPAAV